MYICARLRVVCEFFLLCISHNELGRLHNQMLAPRKGQREWIGMLQDFYMITVTREGTGIKLSLYGPRL